MPTKKETRRERVYCLCRQPQDDRFMICCDTCDEWFHGDCVDVTKAKANHIDEWNCLKCKVNHLASENSRLTHDYFQLLDVVHSKEKEKRDLLVELCEIRHRQSKDLEYNVARLKMEKQFAFNYAKEPPNERINANNNLINTSSNSVCENHNDGGDNSELNVERDNATQACHSGSTSDLKMCESENFVLTSKENYLKHPRPKVSRLSLKYKKTQ